MFSMLLDKFCKKVKKRNKDNKYKLIKRDYN